MRRTVLSVLTTAVLLLPGSLVASATVAAPEEAGTRITGTWRGAVYGDDGAAAGYRAKVRVFKRDGQLRGKVAAGGCYGVWRFQGRRNGWYRFTEVITRDTTGGRCVERVAVKARRDGAKLRVIWREPRSGDTATMLARRV